MPGDSERMRWKIIPPSLERKVVNSIDELKKIFPADRKFGEISLTEKKKGTKTHKIYGRAFRNKERILDYVAYECPGCEKIVIGPPRIEDDTSIKLGMPLAGREGYDAYCTNCHTHLTSNAFANS